MGNFFVLKNKTKISELNVNDKIHESDLAFQEDGCLYQFKWEEAAQPKKQDIKPGVFSFHETNSGIVLKPVTLTSRDLLASALSTNNIIEEANKFFNNLHIYDQLGEAKVRKILLYSIPGCGKSSAIAYYCNKLIEQDPGTVVLVWSTYKIDASDISRFLSQETQYTKECTKLVLLMEDIGGVQRENQGIRDAVSSDMLELLDGIKVTFSIPTLIFATTNYPENMISALADRPGRFDLMMEVKPPNPDDRIAIVKFIAKRDLTEEEEQELRDSRYDDFSVAHLKETVIRSMLHQKSIKEVLKELVEHKKKFASSFENEEDEIGF
jgi:SpoVK/Ycf46/Vps4 family AAA+-type ATPase